MKKNGKRIGFVDYKLDNYHANVYLEILRNDLKRRGFQVAGCTALKAKHGREWAETKGVPYFSSVADMDPHVGAYIVLAPSNPELHLDLCRSVFPFGKLTLI